MTAKTFVPPSGPPNATIVLVGEQPGKTEVKLRRPFVGPAGENLDDCLRAAKIHRGDLYLTNVIKDLDAPLAEYITFSGGKNPQGIWTKKGAEYVDLLTAELNRIRPNIVICCGNVSLWALTSRTGITVWRGSVLHSTLLPGVKVLPTFHPATWTQEKLYANPDAYLNKYLVIMDLKKAKLESAVPEIRLLERKLLIRPSYHEALEFLAQCWEEGTKGATIDYDIELTPGSQELSCISLAINSQLCMSIAFVDSQGDIFPLEQEARIMKELASILKNPAIVKEGQNIIFDSHFLFRKYGILTFNYHDTMVAQRILYPEFPIGLDFITAMWTDLPYYKRDGKIWLGGSGTWENGWKYNCLDSISCADAGPKQRKELEEKGNTLAYQRQMKLIEPLTFMMEKGIKINLEGMQKAQRENTERIGELSQTIHSLMGKELNLNSPPQLCEYFYTTKGIKPYLNPDTQKPTVGLDALRRLASVHGRPEASLLLDLRKLSKQNSTFLNPENVDADGRIRCSYNPVGTKFSRISSSKNIFGTGLNLQNVPHHCLTYFVADPDRVIYSLDYSQYENRLVAGVGNIRQMLEVFESGLDSHRMTAALILTIMGQKTLYEEVTPEERQDFGKVPNHAFNYGLGPNSFSIMHELPLTVGKKIHRAYHIAYPGLRLGYWKYVQNELRRDRTLTNLMERKVTFLGQWSDRLLSEAYSCIPQGTCGDCINERGIIFTYYNSDPLFEDVEILTQIHDSIEIQVPLDVPVGDHAKILIAIKKSLEIPLEFNGKEIKTPVDLVVNTCLNKDIGQEVKGSKFSLDPDTLADELEKAGERLGIQYLPF